MPKVIVYVPAAAWKRLEERGLDPAKAVREFAKRGYEMNGPKESVSGSTPGMAGDARPEGRGDGADSSPALSAEDHFKPDFK